MKDKRRWIIIMMVLIFVLSSSTTVFAHRMLIEVIGEEAVQVKYDNGTFAGMVEVRIYNEENQLVFEGKTDKDGYLRVPENLNISIVIAEDGLGHQARWRQGQMDFWYGAPLWMRAALGVAILLIVAAVTYFIGKNKRKISTEKL
ncbi:hypothetical protein [Natronincola peptidivorans]|nr:hypothetical protein [Natronincola peptidivorans]